MALVVFGCIVCIAGPLAGSFVVGQVLDRMARRVAPMQVEHHRAQPALVAPVLAPWRAPHDWEAQDREVDPRDAARTEQLLQALIATSGFEDW